MPDEERPRDRASERTGERKVEQKKRVFFVLADRSATDERVVLEDSAAVHALADPFRLKIMKLLDKPASARELADAVDRPVTSLYHHLALLEQHGLVTVFDIQREGRSLVRRYRRAADEFETGGDLAEVDELIDKLEPKVAKRNADLTKLIVGAVRAALDDEHQSDKRLRMLLRTSIDPDRLDELAARLRETLDEFTDSSRAADFEIVITVAPTQRKDVR